MLISCHCPYIICIHNTYTIVNVISGTPCMYLWYICSAEIKFHLLHNSYVRVTSASVSSIQISYEVNTMKRRSLKFIFDTGETKNVQYLSCIGSDPRFSIWVPLSKHRRNVLIKTTPAKLWYYVHAMIWIFVHGNRGFHRQCRRRCWNFINTSGSKLIGLDAHFHLHIT